MWLRMSRKPALRWFKCFASGHDFPGALVDSRKRVGFYTTCFVHADSSQDAEGKAIEMLFRDVRLSVPDGICSAGARIVIEEIVPVEFSEIPDEHYGITWYEND